MTLTDFAGFVAAALVLATFSCRDMLRLRFLACASNIAFIIYGVLLDQPPIWLLHGVLLPLNLWILGQLLSRRFRPELHSDAELPPLPNVRRHVLPDRRIERPTYCAFR